MVDWRRYKDEAIEFAVPYVKQAGEYVNDAADGISRKYIMGKKRLKREIRARRLADTVSFLSNLAVLAAAVLVIVKTLYKLIDEYND